MSDLVAILKLKEIKMFEDLKTPVEIDTALAGFYGDKADLEFKIDRLRRAIKVYEERGYYESQKEKAEAEVRGLVLEVSEVMKKIRVLEGKYSGWSRAYLVSNSNGHIHSSTNCSTCFPTTRYVWITQLSGQDNLEIAGLAGEKACSVCYPDAPSEYFMRKCQIEDPAIVKARAERESARAEREAKRVAKGIVNPDGTELKVRVYGTYKETIKTERTAQIWAVDEACLIIQIEEGGEYQHRVSELPDKKAELESVIVALAFKRKVEVEVVRAEIRNKALAKIAKIRKETEKWYQANPQYRP